MTPLHVATPTIQREIRDYISGVSPTLYKNETIALIHVVTLTVKIKLPKYETSMVSYTINETMAPLHVASHKVKRKLRKYEIILNNTTSGPRMNSQLHFMWPH